jgi:hypothetical protein
VLDRFYSHSRYVSLLPLLGQRRVDLVSRDA